MRSVALFSVLAVIAVEPIVAAPGYPGYHSGSGYQVRPWDNCIRPESRWASACRFMPAGACCPAESAQPEQPQPTEGSEQPTGDANFSDFSSDDVNSVLSGLGIKNVNGEQVLSVVSSLGIKYKTRLCSASARPQPTPTQAPTEPTQAPPSEPSPSPSPAPVEPSAAPVEPSVAPVEPSAAPVEPSAAPVEPSAAPVEPSPSAPAPVEPSSEPAPEPTPSSEPAPPVQPSPEPAPPAAESSSEAPPPAPTSEAPAPTSEAPAPAPPAPSSEAPAPAPPPPAATSAASGYSPATTTAPNGNKGPATLPFADSNLSITGPPTDADIQGTSEIAQQILAYHNEIRRLWGAPPVTWDAAAAAAGRDHANKCQFNHDQVPDGFGNNIHASAGSGGLRTTVHSTLDGYAEEWKDFNYGTYSLGDNGGPMVGHWTQMVWKDTTKIGCGWSTACSPSQLGFGDFNGQGFMSSCMYAPPGNYGGRERANIGNYIG